MEPAKEKIRKIIFAKVLEAHNGMFHFEGSHESIYLGEDFLAQKGDRVKISFERVE